MKPFYITTPIYYINAAPHIGHAYTTIAADVLARYHRGRGRSAFLLTGTDEHGQKIEEAAKAAGDKHTLDFCDKVSAKFRDLWKHLDIRHDDYIRTTEKRHEDKVQELFALLMKNGDVYKGKYEGLYDVVSESFVKEKDAIKSPKGILLGPESGKPLQTLSEETYYFKLSKYGPKLLEHYKAHPEFLAPSHRANEILRFVEEGLEDISVSRTKVKWGVPVPGDEAHTVYVWFDALINYWSASRGTDLWPADVHIVGKEIFRFHAVIWPAMLMAAGLPLPKQVFAHGWWTVEGKKMSKSAGNFVDPYEITQEFGVDAFRYFLLREMPFGNDGDFSKASLTKRYNAELANDLGNLVSRVSEMVDKFLGGKLPVKPELPPDFRTTAVAKRTPEIAARMEALDFSGALEIIWEVVRDLNAMVNEKAPWKLAKTDMKACELVLFDLVCSLRLVGGWIDPFMPSTSAKIQMQLGVRHFPEALTAEDVLAGKTEHPGLIQKGPVLFPRKA